MQIVFATGTAVVTMEGGWTLRVEHGSHWPADDPVVISHPGLFSEDPRYGISASRPFEQPVVEQATAAPGEKRATPRSQADAAAEELEQLREEARALGVAVDGRWSILRLRQEIAARRA